MRVPWQGLMGDKPAGNVPVQTRAVPQGLCPLPVLDIKHWVILWMGRWARRCCQRPQLCCISATQGAIPCVVDRGDGNA